MSLNLMKSLKAVVIAASLFAASAANAALYQFTLTGDYSASWQLNSTGTPDDGLNGFAFVIYDVNGNFPGSAFDFVDLYFYNADQDGGFEIYDYYGGGFDLLLTNGAQLYTGLEEDVITFKTGSFALTDFDGPGTYTLTITDLDAPTTPPSGNVPEPASIALLAGGLGLMGAMRRRRYGK